MIAARIPTARRGAALLEALIAMTIFALVAATIVGFASESSGAVRRARTAEAELRRASALLDAVALWPREDLDRHLGDRPQGPWRLIIDRPARQLYSIVLTDSTRRRELLRTALFRRDSTTVGGNGATQ
jgi:type II secretory pathway pseudopilin PulG